MIRAAPQLREDPPANAMMLLMPAAMLLMVVGFVTIGGFNTTALMMGSMMIVATIGMVVSMRGGNRNTRFETARERRAYLDYLDDARAQVSSARDVQLAAATHSGPSPASLPGLIGGNRMWERRIGDPDYTATRIGTARLPLARPLQVQTPGQGYTPEPTCAGALAQFMANHDSVQNVPVMLRLGQLPELSFSGERQARLGLARSMLLNAATLHGPDALLVVAAADGPGRNEWEWLKWLPHNQHPRLRDALGPRRMILNSLDEVAESLAEELAGRTGREPAGPYRPRQDHPQVGPQIIVVDAARNPAATRTLQQTRIPKALMVAGVSIWHLGGPAGGVGLHCIGDHIQMSGAPDVPATVTADGLSRAAATALARQLAPYRLPAHDRGTRFGDGAELADMLGIADPGGVDAAALWRPRSGAQLLCVPIGVDPAGDLVDLDVKESAQGGYGPHGLVIGATGSGKSELLRTLVMALALGHSPDQLNFVLVDFKGGATFAGLGGLPHTSAVITNLADDLTMVDRMFDALSGELNRRQEVLRDAGNLASVRDYEATRTKGARLDPLPSLLVVCDEFSEMLTQKPEFAELFVQIGRLGRSLGIHLLLASQRLEEGRLRGLDSHLSYRIGLKTFSTHESRTVLGVPDAYELPPLPGAGYLKTDHGMTRFQAGYVSGPYREPSRPRGRAVGGARTPLSFVSDPVQLDALPEPAQPDRSTYEDAGDARGRTVLDVMVGRLRGHGTPARQVWLPPLEPAISLGSLPPAATPPGQLQVPVGIVDLPFEQRRDALVVDFSGAAGHGAVIGGSQSGKSTALRTIVTALALAHTPRQVQLYLIDLGGGSLKAVSGLPHVGGYAVRSAPDYVRRMVAEVETVIDTRESLFAELGIETMQEYRARFCGPPANGRPGPNDDPFGDVFLVVDGWSTLRAEFEGLDDRITAITARGLSFGVHVLVSANRWFELRPQFKDNLGTRLELRLGDPADSEIDRRASATVPQAAGRGITAGGYHMLIALPRNDRQNTEEGLAAAYAGLVAALNDGWTGPRAPRVRMLPRELPASELPAPATGRAIALGRNESRLDPVWLDFDADPHFVYFADAESGKSNTLRLIADSIMARYRADEARILVVDYRRALTDHVPAEYLAGYAAGSAGAAAFMADLEPLLRNRLPGPEVTGAQLTARSWWSGPEVFVLVDDYDLAGTAGSPLHTLAPLLAHGKDIGLHVVLARRVAGSSRAMFDPLIQGIRDMASPAFVGTGSKDEGAVWGTAKPSVSWPPGRGVLVHRKAGEQLIQVGHRPGDERAATDT